MKKPKSEIEDEDSYKDLMNKVKKKGDNIQVFLLQQGFSFREEVFQEEDGHHVLAS